MCVPTSGGQGSGSAGGRGGGLEQYGATPAACQPPGMGPLPPDARGPCCSMPTLGSPPGREAQHPLPGSGSQEAERWEAPGWEAVPRAGARPECCRAGWDPLKKLGFPEPARPRRPFYHWPLPRGPPSRPSRAADGRTDGRTDRRTARAARRGGPRSQLQPDCTGVSDHSGGARRGSRPSSRRGPGSGWTAGSPGDPAQRGTARQPIWVHPGSLGVGRAWPSLTQPSRARLRSPGNFWKLQGPWGSPLP